MGSGDKESERCQHRPPAWRNLRRDCCAPRAQRAPGALSLVRGHRKSPEDDELTEDPGATGLLLRERTPHVSIDSAACRRRPP